MRNNIVLTATYYDPDGRLYKPIQQALPVWQSLFDQIIISVSVDSFQPTIDLLHAYDVNIVQREEREWQDLPPLGLYRRTTVAHALKQRPSHILLCDVDRAAYWANSFPTELQQVVTRLPERDFWVIGRTDRAFLSHPRAMIETETIINEIFAKISGLEWDVVAATRGMSASVARYIVENSADDTFGNDPSWPLLVQQDGRFSMGYLATEGMAFETAAAFPEAVKAAGGVENWITLQDADPRRWHYRLQAATVEVGAMLPFLSD